MSTVNSTSTVSYNRLSECVFDSDCGQSLAERVCVEGTCQCINFGELWDGVSRCLAAAQVQRSALYVTITYSLHTVFF